MCSTNTYHKIRKELLEIFNFKVVERESGTKEYFLLFPEEITKELKNGKELYYIGKSKSRANSFLAESKEQNFNIEIVSFGKKNPIYYALY